MIVAKPSTSVSLLLLCLAKLKLEAELIIARDEETHVLSRSICITHVEYVCWCASLSSILKRTRQLYALVNPQAYTAQYQKLFLSASVSSYLALLCVFSGLAEFWRPHSPQAYKRAKSSYSNSDSHIAAGPMGYGAATITFKMMVQLA
jgi:hypothetical protein